MLDFLRIEFLFGWEQTLTVVVDSSQCHLHCLVHLWCRRSFPVCREGSVFVGWRDSDFFVCRWVLRWVATHLNLALIPTREASGTNDARIGAPATWQIGTVLRVSVCLSVVILAGILCMFQCVLRVRSDQACGICLG